MSSDSELEDELLQAAGQAGRKKGSAASKKKRSRKVQSDSDDDDDISLDDESDWEAEELAASTKPKSGTKRSAVEDKEEDDDDDIGAINEDDLITDEEDRLRLAAMTELEREMILAERAEQRQQELQRKRILRAAQGDAAKPSKKKSKTTAARRSGREIREEISKKSAMEELKAARQRKARGEKTAPAGHAGSELEEEEEDAGYEDEELEEGEDDGQLWHPRLQDDDIDDDDEQSREEADFGDVKKIQVRRHRLEDWFKKPFFADAMPGCIARLAGGEKYDPQTGTKVVTYFLAVVVGVSELQPGVHKYLADPKAPGWRSPYRFGPDNEKTSLWLRVMRGNSERAWPMAQVSNQPITEDEFEKWQAICTASKTPLMTIGHVNRVKSKLHQAESYVYTAQDVAKLLQEKKQRGSTVVTNVAQERARLERDLAAATETGDPESISMLKAELDRLDAMAVVRQNAAMIGSTGMAELNKKNADLNFQAALKSGIVTSAHGGDHNNNAPDDLGGTDITTTGNNNNNNNNVHGGATTRLDPFSRRVTRPMIYWNTRGAAGIGDGRDGGDEKDGEEEDKEGARGMNEEERRKKEAELVSLVDLSMLDVSVLNARPRIGALQRKLLGSGCSRSDGDVLRGSVKNQASSQYGRTISLAEYNSRR